MARPESLQAQTKTTGYLQERLWVVLMPALLLFALVGSTWSALLMRDRMENRRIVETEARLKEAIHQLSGQIGHAVETDNRDRYKFHVQALAQVSGGRITLHHRSGGLLAQGSRGQQASHGRNHLIQGNISKEIIVWGPVTGAGGRHVGELRAHVPIPPAPEFPWAFWAGLLAVFALLSAAILFLVTRVLAPLAKLKLLFRQLGDGHPNQVDIPAEKFGEFGQLRSEIVACVDGLCERQQRAEESFVEVAFGLAREYEYHRDGRIGHGQRTCRYASWIADRLRLAPKQRDAVEVASLCHELGKLPPDDSKCWGQGAASEEMHPVLGAAFFEAMPGLEDIAQIIYSYRENYDGSGYPDKLTGDEIPIGARILRIADAFERLYSEESTELSLQEALEEMEEGKGKLYDPHLFEFFREEVAVHMLERRRLKVTLRAYQVGQASLDQQAAVGSDGT